MTKFVFCIATCVSTHYGYIEAKDDADAIKELTTWVKKNKLEYNGPVISVTDLGKGFHIVPVPSLIDL